MSSAGIYRSGDHQPVIPVDITEDACSDVETQAEAYNTDRQGDDHNDAESRTPSLWVDVVWGRPRRHDFGRRKPHVVSGSGLRTVMMGVGVEEKPWTR